MHIDRAIQSFEIELRVTKRSPRTSETYLLACRQLRDWLKDHDHSLDISEITKTEIRGFFGHMLDINSDATAKRRFSSLHVFSPSWSTKTTSPQIRCPR